MEIWKLEWYKDSLFQNFLEGEDVPVIKIYLKSPFNYQFD